MFHMERSTEATSRLTFHGEHPPDPPEPSRSPARRPRRPRPRAHPGGGAERAAPHARRAARLLGIPDEPDGPPGCGLPDAASHPRKPGARPLPGGRAPGAARSGRRPGFRGGVSRAAAGAALAGVARGPDRVSGATPRVPARGAASPSNRQRRASSGSGRAPAGPAARARGGPGVGPASGHPCTDGALGRASGLDRPAVLQPARKLASAGGVRVRRPRGVSLSGRRTPALRLVGAGPFQWTVSPEPGTLIGMGVPLGVSRPAPGLQGRSCGSMHEASLPYLVPAGTSRQGRPGAIH